jgi:hypothetical protein
MEKEIGGQKKIIKPDKSYGDCLEICSKLGEMRV